MMILRGPSLTPSPVRERLVDEPTGDVVDHIVSQHFGAAPVETEALQSLHDALGAHLRAARVAATRGAAIFVVPASTAPGAGTDTIARHRAPPAAVAVITGAPVTAPVVGFFPKAKADEDVPALIPPFAIPILASPPPTRHIIKQLVTPGVHPKPPAPIPPYHSLR